MPYHGFGRLHSVADVQRRLRSAARPIPRRESVELEGAIGRVSAREYRAPAPVPAFPRASWDGYAVRSKDTRSASLEHPLELSVVGALYAESTRARPLRAGEAVEIATGSALPRGADAVAIYEEVREAPGRVVLQRPVRRAERVASIGADFRRGTRLVRAGEVLSGASLGALAAIGRREVEVFARPRVAIVPNGNELVRPGTRLAPGRIYESNHVSLASFCAAAGAVAISVAPIPDDPAAIERGIRRALQDADLVLATGGSSVGERDYLPRVLPRVGRLLFHGIAVRPGKPTLAAVAGGRLIFGLPGHPTSCLANAYWLVLPVLRQIARLPGPGWTPLPARMAEAYPVARAPFTTFVPLRVDRGWAHPTFKDSSAITSLSGANAFLLRTGSEGALRRGEQLVVNLLPAPIARAPGVG